MNRVRLLRGLVNLGIASVLGFAGYFAVGHISTYYQSGVPAVPYGWQDEGYVLGPAMGVYRNGYSAFRCRQNTVNCYGGSSVFFDALVLRLAPAGWLESGALLRPPGEDWFYRAVYPRALQLLRTTRVLFALALALTLGFVAWRMGWPWWSCALVGFTIPSFPAFLASRQGLKNDFPSALEMIPFLVVASNSLRSDLSLARTRAYFFSAILLGVVGMGIKVSLVLPLAILFVAYAVTPGRKNFARAVDLLAGGSMLALLYLVLNPNFRFSSTEATWFLAFFTMTTGRSFDLANSVSEIFDFAVWNLWPAIFLVPILLRIFLHPTRRKTIGSAPFLFLLAVFVVSTLAIVQAGWHREAYYLNPLVVGWIAVFVGGRVAGTPVRGAVWNSVLVALCCLTVYRGMAGAFAESSPVVADQGARVLWDPAVPPPANARFAVDLALRPAIRADRIAPDRLLYFDSLSVPPKQLAQMIDDRWGAEAGVRLIATCWAAPLVSGRSDLRSPAAEEWSRLFGNAVCPERDPANERIVYSFENGSRTSKFADVSWEDWKAKIVSQPEPPWNEDALSPRMFRGAEYGLDQWYSPLTLFSDRVLETEIKFSRPLRAIRLSAESNCKRRGKLRLEAFRSDASAIGRVERSADVLSETCVNYSAVCRFGLAEWWSRRFALPELRIDATVPSDRPIRIRISSEDLEYFRCRLSLGLVRFDFGPG